MLSSDRLPREVLTPQAYAEAFQDGQPVTIPEDAGLLGRIMRGKKPSDFEQLGADGRKLVFVMGSDGLSILPGRPLRESLNTIGLTPDYVQGRIDQGYDFKLVVFQGEGCEETLATWQNVLRQVIGSYPDLEADVTRHGAALQETPFVTFADQMRPHDLDTINLGDPEDPLYMSFDHYHDLTPEERAESPLPLRRLLLHEVHLAPLFDGDGHTRLPNGERGMTEHVIPNSPIAALENPVVIDLPL